MNIASFAVETGPLIILWLGGWPLLAYGDARLELETRPSCAHPGLGMAIMFTHSQQSCHDASRELCKEARAAGGGGSRSLRCVCLSCIARLVAGGWGLATSILRKTPAAGVPGGHSVLIASHCKT